MEGDQICSIEVGCGQERGPLSEFHHSALVSVSHRRLMSAAHLCGDNSTVRIIRVHKVARRATFPPNQLISYEPFSKQLAPNFITTTTTTNFLFNFVQVPIEQANKQQLAD